MDDVSYKSVVFYSNLVYQDWLERQRGNYKNRWFYLMQCMEKNNRSFYAIRRAYFSRCGKISRLKKFINKCFDSGCCVFGTLTFDDEHLELWNSETRQRMVRNYLKSFDYPYVANIDFGDLHGREHYHFIANGFFDMKCWKGGVAWIEHCRSPDDSPRLARYIAKLATHAVKKGLKLIWSRNKKFKGVYYE